MPQKEKPQTSHPQNPLHLPLHTWAPCKISSSPHAKHRALKSNQNPNQTGKHDKQEETWEKCKEMWCWLARNPAALLLPNAGSDFLNEDDTLNQTSKMISIIRVPKMRNKTRLQKRMQEETWQKARWALLELQL